MNSIKILVVDDNALLRLSVKSSLLLCGYRVDEAENGSAALSLIAQSAPDLILLDICLPDMHGIAVLQEARKLNKTMGIIMVTALVRPDWKVAAMEAGADGYLGKPYDFDMLQQQVTEVLDRLWQRRELVIGIDIVNRQKAPIHYVG